MSSIKFDLIDTGISKKLYQILDFSKKAIGFVPKMYREMAVAKTVGETYCNSETCETKTS